MKITKIADKIIVYFVKNNIKFMDIEGLCSIVPKVSQDEVEEAAYMLRDDGFADIIPADDTIYSFSIRSSVIRQVEENTLLKKGYEFFKEIKDFFPLIG